MITPPPRTATAIGHVRRAPPPVLLAVLGVGVLLVAVLAATSVAASRSTAQPPSVATLERRALDQQFTPAHLLGNDAVGIPGTRVVIARVGRAWEAAKRIYLGHPQNATRSRALHEVLERRLRREDQLHGDTGRDGWRIAAARLRLMSPSVRWPGETDRAHRVRVATVLAADRASSTDFWRQVQDAKGKEPSDGVKAVCEVIALGPTVLGAIGRALSGSGTYRADKVRQACRTTGKRVQDTTETVAGAVKDVVTDPLGTLAKGIFGPLLKELQKATTFTAKQVGAAIDRVATPDLSERWVRQMLRRAATIAVLIALVAGILGVAHAAITANLGALGGVAVRAALSGVVGSVVLTVLNVAVVFVDQLTAIAIDAKPGTSGKRFAAFADTATKTMEAAGVPSFVALLLLLVLLLGLVVVWWEMWLRAPLLYAVAFFYGPAYSASLFPPTRQLLSQLNALLAALVLMPLVVLALLEMAVASMQGPDTITAVLQATGLVLVAAASPAILIGLFSPSVALSAAAGMAGALGTGRAIGRLGRSGATRAASASLSAAEFAGDRLRSGAGGTSPGSRDPSGSKPPGGPATGDGTDGPSPRSPGLRDPSEAGDLRPPQTPSGTTPAPPTRPASGRSPSGSGAGGRRGARPTSSDSRNGSRATGGGTASTAPSGRPPAPAADAAADRSPNPSDGGPGGSPSPSADRSPGLDRSRPGAAPPSRPTPGSPGSAAGPRPGGPGLDPRPSRRSGPDGPPPSGPPPEPAPPPIEPPPRPDDRRPPPGGGLTP